MSARVIQGDCLQVMLDLALIGEQVDAIVTDPPYHLTSIVERFGKADSAPAKSDGATGVYARSSKGFMGKEWDGGDIAFQVETWRRAYDLLKPGGYLLAFAATRGGHRMACAIEDAGFEIRDCVGWMFGTGFPKSLNVSKQLEKMGCPDAAKWEGFGTALKPAWEMIYVTRKPLSERTVAANVLEHGTGALNIDASRIPSEGGRHREGEASQENRYTEHGGTNFAMKPGPRGGSPLGRWPANVIHSGCPEVLDAFAQYSGKGENVARFFMACKFTEEETQWLQGQSNHAPASIAAACSNLQSDAAAFVLSGAVTSEVPEAKLHAESWVAPSTTATPSELRLISEAATETIQSFVKRCSRGLPLEGLSRSFNHVQCVAEPKPTGTITITISHWKSSGPADPVTFDITLQNLVPGALASASRFMYSAKASKADRAGSKHPTVKNLALMKYLCRLVCPPGGTVLDMFAGSGTTLQAAVEEGFSAIGIEREDEYVADIKRRLGIVAEDDIDAFLAELVS